MKKAIVVLILLAVMSVCMVAETVITKGGMNLMGKIVAKQNGYIFVQTVKGLKKVAISDIKEIKNDANIGITKRTLRKKDFNKGVDLTKAEVVKVEKINISKPLYNKATKRYKKKYDVKMLPITMVSAALTLRSINALSYYDKQIDYWDKQLNVSGLDSDTKKIIEDTKNEAENMRDKEMFDTIIFGASTILSVVFSFDKVDIQATGKSLNVSYKFK